MIIIIYKLSFLSNFLKAMYIELYDFKSPSVIKKNIVFSISNNYMVN